MYANGSHIVHILYILKILDVNNSRLNCISVSNIPTSTDNVCKSKILFSGFCTARLVSDLVGNPLDRFSHNEAQYLSTVVRKPVYWAFKQRRRKPVYSVLQISFGLSNWTYNSINKGAARRSLVCLFVFRAIRKPGFHRTMPEQQYGLLSVCCFIVSAGRIKKYFVVLSYPLSAQGRL